jgi:hypothetical protein
VTPRPDTSAAAWKSARSCLWAKRASAASVWTNGSAAHRQEPDSASANRRRGLHETRPHKRILCSLLATLPFGSVLGRKRIHSLLIHRIPLIYAPKQLATDHTASGLEILSCYPPRRVAGEKGRHVGNILRRANTLERRLTGSVVVVLFGHHVRISESWR